MSLRLLASVAGLSLIAAAPLPSSRTVLMAGPKPTPAWFICDTMDAPMMVVAGPQRRGGFTRLTLYPKSAPTRPHGGDYAVGPGDAGMSQVYYPLRKGGRDVGNLHFVSPGAFDPETPVKLPAISSVEIEGARAQCRLVPGAIIAGFTARRSLLVIGTPQGLAYQTFDFSRAGTPEGSHLPTVSVEHGRSIRHGIGVEYQFDNGGFTYSVNTPGPGVAAPATLTVLQGGRVVQSEPLIAYSIIR